MHKFIVRVRSSLLVYLTHNMALPLLRLIRKPQKFPYSAQELSMMPKGTLGKDLIDMLNKKNLQLLPYYAKHDIKHILLQYDTTDEGEVCLQCFMLGNGHFSFPVVATVLFGFITMPEYWGKFKQAFHRGRQSICLQYWQWFALLKQPTQSLITKINCTR